MVLFLDASLTPVVGTALDVTVLNTVIKLKSTVPGAQNHQDGQLDGQRCGTSCSAVEPSECQNLLPDFHACVIVISKNNEAINLKMEAEACEELVVGAIDDSHPIVTYCPATQASQSSRDLSACAPMEGRIRDDSVKVSDLRVLWCDASPPKPSYCMTRLGHDDQTGPEVKPLARPKKPPDI